MKRNRIVAMMLFVFCLLCSLCACGTDADKSAKNTDLSEKVLLQASWAYNYSGVEELTKDSDLIAYVSIEKMQSSTDGVLSKTVYQAKVEDLLFGDNQKEVSIVMTGGVIDGVVHEIVDDPLMQKGDKFLIFARENDDGTFTILSGPQGRFVVNDGSVYSLNEASEQVAKANVYSNISVRGTDYDVFVQQVKSYVTE